MSTLELVLTVLAFSAPLVTVSGYLAFAIGFVGESAPIAWIVATIGLSIFAVGYTAMTRHVRRPGAFYSYISVGLGRVFGVGAAYLATIAYLCIQVNIYTFSGVMISMAIGQLGGPQDIPWWIATAISWVIITALGHFRIELSAKFLAIVMALEILLVGIFNIGVLVQGGAEGLTLRPLDPVKFIGPGTGMALLFAFGNFVGFEATALYRDEVRNPSKTVPRATYAAVIFIGLFYALSGYSMVVAYGPSAGAVANANPTVMFDNAMAKYVSGNLATATLLLVATSALASVLSTHNVAARYLQNLAADGALPRWLAAVHPKHHSPYRASFAAAVFVGLILIFGALFVVAKGSESTWYGSFSGIGNAGVMLLMVFVSFAVVRFFRKNGRQGEAVWKVTAAPIIASFLLVSIVLFAIIRFDLLVGGQPGENLWMLFVLLAFLAAGIWRASYMRRRRPDLYALLGRAEAGDDLDEEPLDGVTAPSGENAGEDE